jgi:hypothetical protein
MEAADFTEMLEYSDQNVRRHIQRDIIHLSLDTENHIKIRTKLYGQNAEFFVVFSKPGCKLASIDHSSVCFVVSKLQ